MCCIKIKKVRKALYIASDEQLEFRNEWLMAAAVQLIFVIIDGKYVNFDCKLLCNKQFSILKIPGFGLRPSRDLGLGKRPIAMPTCNYISLLTQAQD